MAIWSLKKSKLGCDEDKKAPKNNGAKAIPPNSQHTQTTLSPSVTDTLKAFEDIIHHQDTALAQKEDEIIRLRNEINECQQQLSTLNNIVKKLEGNLEDSKSTKEDSFREIQRVRTTPCCSDDDSSTSRDDEWSQALAELSDDDESVPTLRGLVSGSQKQLRRRSKTSIRSPRSIRRASHHSLRSSVTSKSRQSIHRDSIRSRQSIREGTDDGMTYASQKSLKSVSLSIKSLPREIELTDDEDDIQDECSFYDDSCKDSCKENRSLENRSVGSRSRNSRASRNSISRKSIVSPRGRQSRRRSSTKDVLVVENKQVMDPCGEIGVYSGALSKSTGMPNGKGLMEYKRDGRWYEGDWVHGRWTGQGRLSNGKGDFYEGGMKNDQKHDSGITRFADGRVFEGKCVLGKMIEGEMTYQDGSVYRGSWLNGVRHGRGKCFFVDGSRYEGEFREGEYHGQGKLTWKDGGWYIGDWRHGEMHGKGKEFRPDGTIRQDTESSRGQPSRSSDESSPKLSSRKIQWVEVRPDGTVRHEAKKPCRSPEVASPKLSPRRKN